MKAEQLINLEDCSGDLLLIADALGIDTARAIFTAFRGCNLYIPSTIPRSAVVRYARQEQSKGRRVKDIAHDLQLTERYIRQLLAEPQQQEGLFRDFKN